MYWLFNRRYFPITGGEKEIVSWSQKRNFKGNVNDSIIFYSEYKEGFHFTHSYKITSVETADFKEEPNEKNERNIILGLSLVNQYTEEKPFYHYVYSFPRVRSFTRYLYRHFKNKYYRLSTQEFNAIDKDRIFVSRTIVGVSLNSMHVDHRKAFIEYLTREEPDSIVGKIDYAVLFGLIKNYMSFAIIEPSHQLIAGFDSAKEFLPSDILGNLSFSDENQKADESIEGQVAVIGENMESFEFALSELVLSDGDEKSFQKIFIHSGLPIDL